MTIKIEFPADNLAAAAALGSALSAYADGTASHRTSFVPPPAVTEPVAAVTEPVAAEPLKPDDELPIVTKIKAVAAEARERETNDTPPALDLKGVAKNDEFCADAQDPFYAAGPLAGQWKKRRGVDQTAYDAWYAGELGDEPTPDAAPTSYGSSFDTPAATPANAGELMQWCAEQQAAGLINQHDVTDAYARLGIRITDLFPPSTPGDVSVRIAALFEQLGGKE